MINEPTAAVMAAGCDVNYQASDGERNIVVFDFGGGTFDLSLLVVDGHIINVEAIGGDMNLGGRDIDEALADYCLQEFEQVHPNLNMD